MMHIDEKDDYRPAPMPSKSPFEQDAYMIDSDLKELNRDKSVWTKLLYWVIFKTVYHVTFVYWYLKGLILRRW